MTTSPNSAWAEEQHRRAKMAEKQRITLIGLLKEVDFHMVKGAAQVPDLEKHFSTTYTFILHLAIFLFLA